MKYTTILPAFLFLAGSALLPISSYAEKFGAPEIDSDKESEEIDRNISVTENNKKPIETLDDEYSLNKKATSQKIIE